MITTCPSEQEIGEREERETNDRIVASKDVIELGNEISHSNNVARLSEIALSNAANFQNQMNNEYIRSVQQEREHADIREKQDQAHKNNLREHMLADDRYTLDRLYSVFPEEAVGLRTLVESIAKKATQEPK